MQGFVEGDTTGLNLFITISRMQRYSCLQQKDSFLLNLLLHRKKRSFLVSTFMNLTRVNYQGTDSKSLKIRFTGGWILSLQERSKDDS